MPFIKKLTAGVGDFTAGLGPLPLKLGGYKAGVLICYEAIFPALSRGSVLAGAGLLVNITNDAWFGKTSAPYQHLEMTLLRAVENRVFLLRAANTGISAVIDPLGRVLKKTELFTEDVLVADVSINNEMKTFYTIYGDVFAYICLFFSGFLVIFAVGRRRSL
jgi:apolipoprotein N-acyltransferase